MNCPNSTYNSTDIIVGGLVGGPTTGKYGVCAGGRGDRDVQPPDEIERTNDAVKDYGLGALAPEAASMHERRCSLRCAFALSLLSPTTNVEPIQEARSSQCEMDSMTPSLTSAMFTYMDTIIRFVPVASLWATTLTTVLSRLSHCMLAKNLTPLLAPAHRRFIRPLLTFLMTPRMLPPSLPLKNRATSTLG